MVPGYVQGLSGCLQTTPGRCGVPALFGMLIETPVLTFQPPVLRSPSSVAPSSGARTALPGRRGHHCGGWTALRRVDGTAEGGQHCGGWTALRRVDSTAEDGQHCGGWSS